MKKIVFDVDGVLISEGRYVDAASLTLWEWLYGRQYMGLPAEQEMFDPTRVTPGELSAIRTRVWGNDHLMHWLEAKRIDGIWKEVHLNLITILYLMAMVYFRRSGDKMSVSIHKAEDVRRMGLDFMGLPIPTAKQVEDTWKAWDDGTVGEEFLSHAIEKISQAFSGDTSFLQPGSDFWKLHVECFSSWFQGDDVYIETYHTRPYSPGKYGFLDKETPLCPAEDIRNLFKHLRDMGYGLGIATLRNEPETRIPFTQFHWMDELEARFVATASDIARAEKKIPGKNLFKPHPFLYECAVWGRDRDLFSAYAEGLYRASADDELWVIGDTMGDLRGAEAIGARFVGISPLAGQPGAQTVFDGQDVPVAANVLEAVEIIEKAGR
jgi:phosphoglycolate phosphatase-like HAD superfamily hydrolase